MCHDFDLCSQCANLPVSSLQLDSRSQHLDSHPLIRYSVAAQAGLQLLDSNNRSINASSGYDRNLFICEQSYEEELVESLICAVCMDVCREGKRTNCGHNYCSVCLSKSLLIKSECPLDRLSLGSNFLQETTILDLDLREEIQRLEVRCSNSEVGCSWRGRLVELLSHLKSSCNWTECAFARFGCTVRIDKSEQVHNESKLNEYLGEGSIGVTCNNHQRHQALVYQQMSSLSDNNAKLAETITDGFASFRGTIYPIVERQQVLSSNISWVYQQ